MNPVHTYHHSAIHISSEIITGWYYQQYLLLHSVSTPHTVTTQVKCSYHFFLIIPALRRLKSFVDTMVSYISKVVRS